MREGSVFIPCRSHTWPQSNAKNPATPVRWRGYRQIGRMLNYFLERLEAFNGLIFWADAALLEPACVARLQFPFFHLVVGSGQAVQYHPEAISKVRLHPLHCSTISWQTPPLYPQPFAVMKAHSTPLRTVVHFILRHLPLWSEQSKRPKRKDLRPFQNPALYMRVIGGCQALFSASAPCW